MPITIIQKSNGIKVKLGEQVADVDLSSVQLPELEKHSKSFQKLCDNFPKSSVIPGVKEVEELVSPAEPKMLLIHCGQSHNVAPGDLYRVILNSDPENAKLYTPLRCFEIAKDCVDAINRNVKNGDGLRENIVKSIDYFRNEYGINSVYEEGYAVGMQMEANREMFSHLRSGEAINIGDRSEANTQKLINLLESNWSETPSDQLQEMKKQIIENYLYKSHVQQTINYGEFADVGSKLHDMGFTLLPTEVREIVGEMSLDKAYHENRENLAISIVSNIESRGDRIGILVYGNAHDFKNNVVNWNKSVPTRAIKLVKLSFKDEVD